MLRCMAKAMTYSQACTRFANLATVGITIADAVIEAVDRIYEMGRYPGTTEEVPLAAEDFLFDSDNEYYYVLFDEETYDGAIGFRNNHGGWGIMDQVALFKDGVNAGDREFIDFNSVGIFGGYDIAGTIEPEVDGRILVADDHNGRASYSTDGEITPPTEGTWIWVYYNGEGWTTARYDDGEAAYVWSTDEDVLTPDLAETWTPIGGGEGNLIFTSFDTSYRKYRCPLGWNPDYGPYFAMMKLEAPELEANTPILIATGALKHAVLGVSYEYTADDERATLNWQKFDLAMQRAERQTNGPKKWTLGMDKSLRRHPRQFR